MGSLENLINITIGSTGSDCTSQYLITIKKEFTVKDFICAVISNPREWGHIDVLKKSTFSKDN